MKEEIEEFNLLIPKFVEFMKTSKEISEYDLAVHFNFCLIQNKEGFQSIFKMVRFLKYAPVLELIENPELEFKNWKLKEDVIK